MYIVRNIESEINAFMSDREIIAVIGPRQAGKTTTINKILNNFKNKKINRLSFENPSVLNLFDENIDAFIEKEIKGYDIVFIDEFQYSRDGGKKLKYIYDTINNVKLLISGSSATELSIHSIKYLVGRIIVLNLYPLSFEEFLRFKNEKLHIICKRNLFSNQIRKELLEYIKEYLTYGGYPRVVTENSHKKKKIILRNILNTYLLKEINEILKYKESRFIENTAMFLASQLGGPLNYSDLSAKTETSIYELKNILNILEKTFIIFKAPNYHTNKQTELVKSPKIYFHDLGFRNTLLNHYEETIITGELYENFIAAELIKKYRSIKYWRTKSGAEVDFIINKGGNLIPVEVKTQINKDVVGKSLISFIKKYSPKEAYILSTNYTGNRKINTTKLYFLSYPEFIYNKI